MAWIESHQSLGRHPKLLRLALKLRIHKAQAVGHLKYLWWWALDFAPTGNLSAFTSAEISAAAEWSGDTEVFFEALKDGWIDPDGCIHDWSEYAGNYLSSLERQKRYREKLRNSNVTVTATVHNKTKPTVPTKQHIESVLEIPEPLSGCKDAINDWLAYKRDRKQGYKGERGLNALWKTLLKIPDAQRVECIERSMANGWAGLFPLKDGQGASNGKTQSSPTGAVKAEPGKYAGIGTKAN